MMFEIRAISDAVYKLSLPRKVQLAVQNLLTQLSTELEDGGFESGSDLELASLDLQATLLGDAPSNSILAPGKYPVTATGFLLIEAANTTLEPAPVELTDVLKTCLGVLDSELYEVGWIPPVKMRSHYDQLAKVLGQQIPLELYQFKPPTPPPELRRRVAATSKDSTPLPHAELDVLPSLPSQPSTHSFRRLANGILFAGVPVFAVLGVWSAGVAGLVTGLVTPFLVSVHVALAVHPASSIKFQGILGAIAVFVGAVLAGWRWGWLGAFIGAIVATMTGRIVHWLAARTAG